MSDATTEHSDPDEQQSAATPATTVYPDTNKRDTCPEPPTREDYDSLEVVATGPVSVERDVSLAGPQEFVLSDTTTATVRTRIREFQELKPFLQRRNSPDKKTALGQLTAYPSDHRIHIDDADAGDWQIEFRATIEDWQTVATDLADADHYTDSKPETAVKKLRKLVCAGLTDDSAIFAVLNLVDKHDVDVDWDRDVFLERAVDTDEDC